MQSSSWMPNQPFSHIVHSHHTTTGGQFQLGNRSYPQKPQHITQFFEGQNFLHCCHQTSIYPEKSNQLTDWLTHNLLHATPTTSATSCYKIKCLIKKKLENMVRYLYKMPCKPPSKHIFFSTDNLSLTHPLVVSTVLSIIINSITLTHCGPVFFSSILITNH
jgi:hypothetical protein